MNRQRWWWMCAALAASLGGCASIGRPEVEQGRISEALAQSADAEKAVGDDAADNTPAPFMRPPRPLVDDGSFYVLGSEAALPRVRYLDGQVSLNESCAIRRGNKLSRKIPPIYVNGRPIGFC